MSDTLEELAALLTRSGYTPRGEDELRERAERRARADYEEKVLSARQDWEEKDSALARELESLAASYGEKRSRAVAGTEAALSALSRDELRRGMQRSSYGAASRGNLAAAGLAAQSELDASQSVDERALSDRRAALSARLADTVAQYDASRRSAARSELDSLLAAEEEKARAAEQSRLEAEERLYRYRRELEQEEQAQANWLAEFTARYGGKTKASGKKSGSGASDAPAAPVKSSAKDGLAGLKGML